jgi:hypothetical protein
MLRILTESSHDVLLVSRPDIIFKPLFPLALEAAQLSKVLYTFQCWTRSDTINNEWRRPRVADMLTWFPRRSFNKVLASNSPEGFVSNHKALDLAVSALGKDGVGFILPEDQHDSDPEKDANPLYLLAARSEGRDVWSRHGVYEFETAAPSASPPGPAEIKSLLVKEAEHKLKAIAFLEKLLDKVRRGRGACVEGFCLSNIIIFQNGDSNNNCILCSLKRSAAATQRKQNIFS